MIAARLRRAERAARSIELLGEVGLADRARDQDLGRPRDRVDIAGTGVVEEGSMREALEQAVQLAGAGA